MSSKFKCCGAKIYCAKYIIHVMIGDQTNIILKAKFDFFAENLYCTVKKDRFKVNQSHIFVPFVTQIFKIPDTKSFFSVCQNLASQLNLTSDLKTSEITILLHFCLMPHYTSIITYRILSLYWYHGITSLACFQIQNNILTFEFRIS